MKRSLHATAAFSLVEVTLALGVAAISLMAIFGLLVTGIQTNHTAVEQSSSSDILTAVAADLRATPKANSTSTQFGIAIPSDGNTGSTLPPLYFNSQGKSSATLTTDSRYQLTIKFIANGGGTRSATFAHLRMTWPAAANPATVNTSAAETFVALDRH
jgi:uncharacterized protein (TIGR02598 family)